MASLAIGLIDSGVAGLPLTYTGAARGFLAGPQGTVLETEATEDQLGHGSAMAAILLRDAIGRAQGDTPDDSPPVAPEFSLLNAQVFAGKLSCTAAQVAAALDWLLEQRVHLVNMSFGLREDRPLLRQACERALGEGVVLVAATPARGEPVFPAAYPGVIRATGDARCAPGDISFLDTRQADFGGHVRAGQTNVAGASVGCAHVSARAARFLAAHPGSSPAQLRAWLVEQASYRGPERRVC
ncbi:MAG: S8 family serine peptidase [Gammaproteobacteria bacterium]|jgi:subtilisin family serine protease|nr:S8 family serine peptidase [Gammaproteobacteria bacterium]MDH5172882.1 S8 family serine peptidase [Gammaproteobacteria bacterium]